MQGESRCCRSRGTAALHAATYVGQTERSPEDRARQHELGPKYPWKKKPNHSRPAHNYFRKLALELLPPKFQKKLLCRSAALRAERDLRLYFKSKGYEVEGGTELLPKKAARQLVPLAILEPRPT